MSADEQLRGSCNCGRYNYVVCIPGDTDARQVAQVHFGISELDRRSQASLLSAWLRVPLTWYQSTTVAFLPNESHNSIARTFTPWHQPGCQRKFCGFCGTHISYWTEQPTSEQDFMNITLGSLRHRDILALEDLELLPEDVDLEKTAQSQSEAAETHLSSIEPAVTSSTSDSDGVQTSRSGTTSGISWFEAMIQGSQMGHHGKRRQGYGTSADGTTTVQWEISEYFEGEEEPESTSTRSKRKAADIATDHTTMRD